uniref:RING-type domain-containing protein n=1 Tax=Arundo donax TaxID=35708 RepID=A0A0A9CYU7_ARUDO
MICFQHCELKFFTSCFDPLCLILFGFGHFKLFRPCSYKCQYLLFICMHRFTSHDIDILQYGTLFIIFDGSLYYAVCRKCIYKKLNDEELDHCPVCKIDLGCAPVEKLRADHNLQDVRSKVFPFKRKKINAEDVESPITLPVKRKERSISSLVVNTPRITPAGSTGRRTRAVTRKAAALRGLGPIIVDPLKKDNDNLNKQTDNSSLLDILSKVPQTRRQVLSNGDTSSHPSGKDKPGDNKDLDKAELWRPLNCFVEAANKTKPSRGSAQSPAVKGDKPNESPSSEHSSRTKAREPLQKSKVQDEKKDDPEPIVLLRKKGPGRRRKHPLSSTNAASSGAGSQNEKILSPVWFSLIASFDQKGAPPLPQIPAHYLRIRDGNISASSIQKYIMQKLSLISESEVEISCCGQPVNPAQPVRNLVERWLRVGPTRPLQTVIGSSGGDYVMVISYGRPKSASS